jgi:hypothetical protein
MAEPQNPTPPVNPPKPADGPAPTPPGQANPSTGHAQPPGQAKADGEFQKVDLVFNEKSIVKLDVPASVNLDKAWQQFQDEHKEISDKRGAFPTSFVGDLVNKHGCKQVDSKAEGYTKKNFSIG